MLSNALQLGQVLAGAPTATPTLVWTPGVPPGLQWLMNFVAVAAFAIPIYNYSPSVVFVAVAWDHVLLEFNHSLLPLVPSFVPSVHLVWSSLPHSVQQTLVCASALSSDSLHSIHIFQVLSS